MELTHGSLFDGGGGARIGFEQAGFKTQWTIEIDGRFTDEPRDIADYGSKYDLVPASVISGGPPCINTSQAAALHGRRTHHSLWPEMLRVVSSLKPSFVVVEQPLGGFSVILQASQELQRIGYGCAARVIDSRHWVPQTRSRWFLIGAMGWNGMALWDRLYPDSDRMARRVHNAGEVEAMPRTEDKRQGKLFSGSCPDCLRSGVFARISSRKAALVSAGNAWTVDVAEFIAWRIREVMEAAPDAAGDREAK